MAALAMEEMAQTLPPSGSGRKASPCGAPLSMTTSASSNRRLPEGCREVIAFECSRDVRAMTVWPSPFAISAISTVEPLPPDWEAIRITSPGRIGARSQTLRASAGSRSAFGSDSASAGRSPSSTASRRASLLVGIRPPARPLSSMARASEWPVPNTCSTPPAARLSAIRSAARATGPAWPCSIRSRVARISAYTAAPVTGIRAPRKRKVGLPLERYRSFVRCGSRAVIDGGSIRCGQSAARPPGTTRWT